MKYTLLLVGCSFILPLSAMNERNIINSISFSKIEVIEKAYPKEKLFDTYNNPRPELKELLQLTGVEHKNSLASIAHEIKKPYGKGGWQVPSAQKDTFIPLALVPVLEKLQFIDNHKPKDDFYDYIIINALALKEQPNQIIYRLWYLQQMLDQHAFSYKKIYALLPSNNPLYVYKEIETTFFSLCEQSTLQKKFSQKIILIPTFLHQSVDTYTTQDLIKEGIFAWSPFQKNYGAVLLVTTSSQCNDEVIQTYTTLRAMNFYEGTTTQNITTVASALFDDNFNTISLLFNTLTKVIQRINIDKIS